jgi:magnesium-protoporphyrin IX monomethyl ester (oxidative) cyclase
MTDVCLVSMPYAGIERPSLALGLLKACLHTAESNQQSSIPISGLQKKLASINIR